MSDGHGRSGTSWLRLAAVLLVVVVAGWLLGGVLGRQQRDGAQDEQRELEAQTERITSRADATQDALDQLGERAKGLEPSILGEGSFMPSARSTTPVKLGEPVVDDGDTGTVTGVRVVDEFTSINEERLPGRAAKGYRWVVVGGTYRTNKPDDITEACDGDTFVTAVLTDGTTIGPEDVLALRGQPRFPEQAKGSCSEGPGRLGKQVEFRSALPVPEGTEIRGLLVGDMRRRSGTLAERIPKTKLGWLEFDDPLDVRKAGQEVESIGKEPTLS